MGDISKSFLVELKDKMKHKFKLVKQENEKIAEVRPLKETQFCRVWVMILIVCCVLYEWHLIIPLLQHL